MSFKEIGLQVCTAVDNEFVRLRADQIAMGEQLNGRIDSVATQLNERIDGVATQLNERIDGVATQLNERIDGVAEQVKLLDGRVGVLETKVDNLEVKVDRLDAKVDGLQEGHTEMMHILIAIQRKLDVN
ncbi:hypothetical protein [Nonomuraea sp. NPDC049709]|uniref:hypothetical protein n=1 Tax=Nonomuraea sp. NPDC049709 TaxID=3154736 RepID=UPI0034339360